MRNNIVGKCGFLIARILFLGAAVVPFERGQTTGVALFVIGIAFLLIGATVVRKRPPGTLPKG